MLEIVLVPPDCVKLPVPEEPTYSVGADNWPGR